MLKHLGFLYWVHLLWMKPMFSALTDFEGSRYSRIQSRPLHQTITTLWWRQTLRWGYKYSCRSCCLVRIDLELKLHTSVRRHFAGPRTAFQKDSYREFYCMSIVNIFFFLYERWNNIPHYYLEHMFVGKHYGTYLCLKKDIYWWDSEITSNFWANAANRVLLSQLV